MLGRKWETISASEKLFVADKAVSLEVFSEIYLGTAVEIVPLMGFRVLSDDFSRLLFSETFAVSYELHFDVECPKPFRFEFH